MDKLAHTAFIFDIMEKAVAASHKSEHPVNKIGAALFQPDTRSSHLLVACNERPVPLQNYLSLDARVGSSSQCIHAEMNALFRFKGRLMGSHLCVTDPFCPNCGKMAALAGVRHIYIDKDGFKKEFASRRADEFTNMSMRIAQKAGIHVDVVDRSHRTIEPIYTSPIQTRFSAAHHEFFDIATHASLESVMENMLQRFGHTSVRPYAVAIAENLKDNRRVGVLAYETMPPGFTFSLSTEKEGKYRYPIDPLNNLLIVLKQKHLQLSGNSVGSSHLPSSRALVHAVRFGVRELMVGNIEPEHDIHAPEALNVLKPVLAVHLITPPDQSRNT